MADDVSRIPTFHYAMATLLIVIAATVGLAVVVS